MGKPITEDEVLKAIGKLKTSKAPGNDGIIAALYKKFAGALAPVLVGVFNEAFESMDLPSSLKVAIIILLYKKDSKDEAGNYRPISLTNVDYKILAYVLTELLIPYLNDVIHSSQTAYILRRFIGMNIHKIQDVIDFAETNNKQWVILFLDFQKAFDSALHLFLMTLLRIMGFPTEYIAWILLLHTNASSMVWNKGWLLSRFSLGRGIRQGCPLSCYLFNLVGQVMVYYLQSIGIFT